MSEQRDAYKCSIGLRLGANAQHEGRNCQYTCDNYTSIVSWSVCIYLGEGGEHFPQNPESARTYIILIRAWLLYGKKTFYDQCRGVPRFDSAREIHRLRLLTRRRFSFSELFLRICHRLLQTSVQIGIKFRDTGMSMYFWYRFKSLIY